MAFVGNILWWFFGGGFLMAFFWMLYGLVMCLTIVGIPFGVAAFRLAGYAAFPFGRELVDKRMVGGKRIAGTGFANFIWVISFGLLLSIKHALLGMVYCLSIVGIPFGLAHFKLCEACFAPLGKEIVSKDLAKVAREKKARDELETRNAVREQKSSARLAAGSRPAIESGGYTPRVGFPDSPDRKAVKQLAPGTATHPVDWGMARSGPADSDPALLAHLEAEFRGALRVLDRERASACLKKIEALGLSPIEIDRYRDSWRFVFGEPPRREEKNEFGPSVGSPAVEVRPPRGTCPACGLANLPESRYCEDCGEKMFEVCPNCQQEITLSARFCRHCGGDMEEDRRRKREEAARKAEEEERERRKREIASLARSCFEAGNHKEVQKHLRGYRDTFGQLPEELSRLQDENSTAWAAQIDRKIKAACQALDILAARSLVNGAVSTGLPDSVLKKEYGYWTSELEACEARLRKIAERIGALVAVKPGNFRMGYEGPRSQRPVREVIVSRGFLIGKYPVTQKIWQSIMGGNPSRFEGDERPVENVSWVDAAAFCRQATKILRKEGMIPSELEIRLPGEAEWEYACRAGTTTRYYWGNELNDDYCWNFRNSKTGGFFSVRRTHPVGEKKPNAWGLHDMIGNVCEWCLDTWHPNYRGAPTDATPWIDKPNSTARVLRGGCWNGDDTGILFASHRESDAPTSSRSNYGLRVVLAVRAREAVPKTAQPAEDNKNLSESEWVCTHCDNPVEESDTICPHCDGDIREVED